MFTIEMMYVVIDVQAEASWVPRKKVSKSTEIRAAF